MSYLIDPTCRYFQILNVMTLKFYSSNCSTNSNTLKIDKA